MTFNDRERHRILAGQQADKFSNKWLVHLEGIGCSGAIIGANWVLTSAECCDGADMKSLFTAANDWDYKVYYDTETIHIPDQKIIHPGYNRQTKNNNICLLHYTNHMMVVNGMLEADIACLPTKTWNKVFKS